MTNRPGMLRVLGLGFAVLAICGAVHQAPTPSADSAPAASAPSPGTAGLRAFIDPQTGELRGPTAEELAQMALENPVDLGKLPEIVVTEHPGGMKSAVLDERFMATSVAKIGPDGSLITECVTTQAEFDAFFANESAPTGPEVR